LTGVAILDDFDALDPLDLVEELAELLRRRGERQAADEKFLGHGLISYSATWTMRPGVAETNAKA
jgi:hypothetical protein